MNNGTVRLRRSVGALLALFAAAVMLLGGAGTASAHAALISTDPAQNSVVPSAPGAVTLTFSEGVTLNSDSVRVLDPAGRQVDAGDPGHADGKADTARVSLHSGLADGTYTVAWRAISEDSHPVGGAFTFSIGAPSDTSVSASAVQGAKADGLVAFAYGTGRTVAYAAFALLVGSAAFVLVCWPAGAASRRVQRLLMTGWIGLLVATVAVLLLRGPYERGTGIGQALDLLLVRGTLNERIGTALATRLLLLAAGGVFLSLLVGQLGQPQGAGASPGAGADADADADPDADDGSEEAAELRALEERAAGRPLRDARLGLGVAGLVLSIALAATWAGADHSAVGMQVGLALPLAVLHLLAMAGWLGGLVTLLVGLREGVPTAAVERFSRLALWAVTALVLTGVYQSWRGVGSWAALVDTEYGRLLLVKVGCVAAMVGVAWISRSWVARLRTASDDADEASGTATMTQNEAPGRATKARNEISGTAAMTQDNASGTAAMARDNASGTAAMTQDEPSGTAAITRDEQTESATDAAAPEPAAAGDPRRAAQLARQRAARVEAGARLAKDGTPTRAGLRRSVLVEACVAVAVLAVTTMLTNSPPGRVAQAVAAAPRPAGVPSGASTAVPGKAVELKLAYDTGGKSPNAKGTATVDISPAGVGGNTVRLALDESGGQPAEVPEVQLGFTLPDRDLGPLPVALKPEGTGRWSGTAQLPLAGNWVVSVTVRSSDIDQATSVQQLKIGG